MFLLGSYQAWSGPLANIEPIGHSGLCMARIIAPSRIVHDRLDSSTRDISVHRTHSNRVRGIASEALVVFGSVQV